MGELQWLESYGRQQWNHSCWIFFKKLLTDFISGKNKSFSWLIEHKSALQTSHTQYRSSQTSSWVSGESTRTETIESTFEQSPIFSEQTGNWKAIPLSQLYSFKNEDRHAPFVSINVKSRNYPQKKLGMTHRFSIDKQTYVCVCVLGWRYNYVRGWGGRWGFYGELARKDMCSNVFWSSFESFFSVMMVVEGGKRANKGDLKKWNVSSSEFIWKVLI